MAIVIYVPQDASALTLFAHIDYALAGIAASRGWRERYSPSESFADMRFAARGLFDVDCLIGPPEGSNLKTFRIAFTQALLDEIEKNPGSYGYSASAVPLVVERMIVAFCKGTANHDGTAFKRAMKSLGVKLTTRKARQIWINSQAVPA